MVNRNLLRELDSLEEEGPRVEAPFDEPPSGSIGRLDAIVTGRVLRVTDHEVWVEVGAKSPGVVSRKEWERADPPRPVDAVEVLIASDDGTDAPRLSHLEVRFERQWREFVATRRVGEVVSATVTGWVPGGLSVDIGVPAFLPASQVDIRRPPDLTPYVGMSLSCKILTIDSARRNVVVSRRAAVGGPRPPVRPNVLAEIEAGQIRTGVVKNIAEFGAFVDLGGIDGLLHVTEMSWERVNKPSDIVRLDEAVEVSVVSVDRARGRITLSLRHKTPDPWPDLADRYPVGSRQAGEVVRVVTYGAWVKLASGPEGLVHISEMSWARQFATPSECVAVGDEIEVQVLSVKPEKKELALGMRQVVPNPWDGVVGRYPAGATVSGVVCNVTNYGVFVEIEAGIRGLIHLADMRTQAAHPGEVVSLGDRVLCVVLGVDAERGRIALGLCHPSEATAPLLLPADAPGPPRIPADVLAWGDGLAARMARDIREARAFDELPILADALEDAGCVEEAVLEHLRDGHAHARRCWVLDLILGRARADRPPAREHPR